VVIASGGWVEPVIPPHSCAIEAVDIASTVLQEFGFSDLHHNPVVHHALGRNSFDRVIDDATERMGKSAGRDSAVSAAPVALLVVNRS
jgi:hypothetical protein